MTVIAPSLLSCDFLNLEKELIFFSKIEHLWFHLDIMDGHFVPNLTFGHPLVEKIARISTHKLDAHLMVTNPEFYVETFKNIHNFTFHWEATREPLNLIEAAKKKFPSVGISIKPDTDLKEIPLDILQSVDLLLIMSVMPGFSGQKFQETTYDKVANLSSLRIKHSFSFAIQVDGGVNEKNAPRLIRCGVDNLVAGSYIFNTTSDNYASRVESLRKR